jgi:fructosamine-3-kinase
MHPLLSPEIGRTITKATAHHLGRRWASDAFFDLSERASHPCGVFHGQELSVFAKLSVGANGLEEFGAELKGHALLQRFAGIATPIPVGAGLYSLEHGQLLLYEALVERPPQARTPDDWRSIGRTLAELHQVHDQQFGLERFDGFFGPLPQDNRPVMSNRWSDFYLERRVAPRLKSAVDCGHLPMDLARDTTRLMERIPGLVGPEPRPSLLHGDAQENNFITTDTGAVVVDVAPYFGHPEVDLAFVDLFEPVPEDLFNAYRAITPIDPDFDGRRDLWRVSAYLAAVTVDVASSFGRTILVRLADVVRGYL